MRVWGELEGRQRGDQARPHLCSVCHVQAFRPWAIGSGEQLKHFESRRWYRVCILESSGKKEKPDQVEKSIVGKWILLSGALDDTNLKILWRGGGAANSWPPRSVGQWSLSKYRAFGGQCSPPPR